MSEKGEALHGKPTLFHKNCKTFLLQSVKMFQIQYT